MGSSFDLHRDRRDLFGRDVDSYDDGRPGYPDELFQLLVDVCDLRPGLNVVEIGPGTGQATGALLDRGARVVAVEVSAELAARLVTNHAGRALTVIVDAFESVDLPAGQFDMVVAATSFHWVPPEIGLVRAAELLRPGGWLALWWNYFGDPNRSDPLHEQLQPILTMHAPQLLDPPGSADAASGAHPYALDADARLAEINANGSFVDPRYELISWTGRHTAHEIRMLFASFSPWLALDSGLRNRMLDQLEALATDRFGGNVVRPYLTSLYVARRKP